MKIIIFIRHFNDFDNVLPIVDYLIRVKRQKDVEIYGAREQGYQTSNKHLSYVLNILGKRVVSFTNTCLTKTDRILLRIDNRVKKISQPNNKFLKFLFSIFNITITRFVNYLISGSVKRFVKNLPENTIIMADFGNEAQFPYKYLIKYCHKRSITILSYLHGYSIFSNVDSYRQKSPMLNSRLNRIVQSFLFGKYSKDYYDKYLVGIQQRDTYMSSLNHDGFTAQSRVVEVGLPRYTREWIYRFIKKDSKFDNAPVLNVNKADKFRKYKKNNGKNVILFLSNSKFNVNEKKLSETMHLLASCENINLIIKMHTRGGTPELIREVYSNFSQYLCDYDSSELIEWADIGLAYGTSMSIQMLVEGLTVVVPSYIDSNTTILEDNKVCINASSLDFLRNFLLNYPSVKDLPNEESINNFIKKFVYGDCDTYNDLMDKFTYFLDE